jgi:hypothetical protein
LIEIITKVIKAANATTTMTKTPGGGLCTQPGNSPPDLGYFDLTFSLNFMIILREGAA